MKDKEYWLDAKNDKELKKEVLSAYWDKWQKVIDPKVSKEVYSVFGIHDEDIISFWTKYVTPISEDDPHKKVIQMIRDDVSNMQIKNQWEEKGWVVVRYVENKREIVHIFQKNFGKGFPIQHYVFDKIYRYKNGDEVVFLNGEKFKINFLR